MKKNGYWFLYILQQTEIHNEKLVKIENDYFSKFEPDIKITRKSNNPYSLYLGYLQNLVVMPYKFLKYANFPLSKEMILGYLTDFFCKGIYMTKRISYWSGHLTDYGKGIDLSNIDFSEYPIIEFPDLSKVEDDFQMIFDRRYEDNTFIRNYEKKIELRNKLISQEKLNKKNKQIQDSFSQTRMKRK